MAVASGLHQPSSVQSRPTAFAGGSGLVFAHAVCGSIALRGLVWQPSRLDELRLTS